IGDCRASAVLNRSEQRGVDRLTDGRDGRNPKKHSKQKKCAETPTVEFPRGLQRYSSAQMRFNPGGRPAREQNTHDLTPENHFKKGRLATLRANEVVELVPHANRGGASSQERILRITIGRMVFLD